MKKTFIIILIINAALLLLLGIDALCYSNIANSLQAQREGERFGGKVECAQVSSFFPPGEGLTFNEIRQLRVTLEKSLGLQSVESLTPNAPLYLDAFAVNSDAVQIKSESNTTTTANAIVVGGEFFEFHPLLLRGGGYFYPDELMRDRIVIDERAAWNLFGSYNIEGMYVTIGDRIYEIAGVVQLERDSASIEAYELQFGTANSCVFIPYEVYDPNGTELRFTSYEYVTQNLFGLYVYQLISNETMLDGSLTVMNTDRFELWGMYDKLANFSDRTLRVNAVVYPYWENAAVLAENRLTILALLGTICAAIPILSVIFLFGWLLKKSKGKGKVIVEFAGDVMDIWNRWQWKRKLAKSAAASEIPPSTTAESPDEVSDVAADDEVSDDEIQSGEEPEVVEFTEVPEAENTGEITENE
ncbi:MAG: ABC transporter permease [Oscillospiraceae bacterium]|jgi:hypothetical protein|nr:ABC transporter permease [Oscillospiraceae bacterium]